MFGRLKIKQLKSELEYAELKRDEYWKRLCDKGDDFARKESELKILQEAFRNGVKITEGLKEELAGLESETNRLEYELGDLKTLTQSLREEAIESSRMLELYKALLGQLRIVVNLPAKKKNG